MSTLTPNYYLEKPEATDPFGDFRQSYNANMDIIDANLGGGGGSGGHTILDGDGNALPQEDDLQFTGACSVTDDNVNGRTVVDIKGGNVYGAFLDPSRVIYSAFTFDNTEHSWTATEDVILTDDILPPSGSMAWYVRIDEKQVGAGYDLGNLFVYVKKGQVVKYRAKSGSTMKAYALIQGTNGIFAPVIYSDTERKIGVWRDNKPLYKKTFHFNSTVWINANGWTNGINVDTTDVETLVDAEVLRTIGAYSFYGYLQVVPFNNLLNIFNCRNTNMEIDTITHYYTKTTDVAGSGDYNTLGVPTVHYSTSEQVIGTWFGTIVKNNIAMGNNGGTLTSIAHGVSDLKECVRLNMSCPKLGYCTGDNLTSTAGVVIATFRVDGTSVYCSGGTNYFGATNDRYWYITIQYTKTTD